MTFRRGRGRLDNGLDAALWSPLRDVDPRVGEHLLDVLSSAGIAAYLEPSADVGPYTRSVFLPSPPSDRLFVDRARRREARGLVDELIEREEPRSPRNAPGGEFPEPARRPARDRTLRPDLDEDAEWAAIVAALEAEAEAVTEAEAEAVAGAEAEADGATPREEVPADDDRPTARLDSSTEPLPPPPPPHEPAILDLPDEHFQPPPAPPVPVPAPAALYAVLLVAAGLLLIGAPQVLLLSADVGLLLGVTAIAAGVAMLVARMGDHADDDGDDGAVV